MGIPKALLSAVVVLSGLAALAGTALAANPAIYGTGEAILPNGGGRILLVFGTNLTKISVYELDQTNGTLISVPTVIYRSKTMALLMLPATLAPPTYALPGNFSLKYTYGTTTDSTVIRLTMGYSEAGAVASSALDAALRADLDVAVDSALVGGESTSQLHDAANLTGTISTSRFAAYDDLVAETKIGTGSAQVSAGNHAHTGTYVRTAGGDTVSGQLTISSSGTAISATSGTTSSTAGGIDCTTAGGIGVAGHGNTGLLGETDSDGSVAVKAKASFNYQYGVHAQATGRYSTAVYARNTGYYGHAIFARSTYRGATGIFAGSNYGTALSAYSYAGIGARVRTNYFGIGLLVEGDSTTKLAIFQNSGNNVARINASGKGYFNGGTATSGADFAESVKVEGSPEAFEPGDVMAIDPKAPRQFALSREANSTLVAGVISTKPALLGTIHDVSATVHPWRKEEVELGIVGIVPTKVCDEGGAVRIGDLLVAASRPGHAKKAPPNPPAGTVIGKALAALEKGTAKIEVLLTLR